MIRTLSPTSIAVALGIAILATLGVSAAHAQDAGADFDIGPKFRAKIAKEKAKQAARQSDGLGSQNGSGSNDAPQCGAQNIGNVDTNGRPGAAPREVFVFAPNAINLVSNGCN
jgi:hypothetical protein